jgi:hypothetical protein
MFLRNRRYGKMKKEEGRGLLRGMEQVCPLEPTVHHCSNPERSIKAESRVHQVPLDDTLMATADDFLVIGTRAAG